MVSHRTLLFLEKNVNNTRVLDATTNAEQENRSKRTHTRNYDSVSVSAHARARPVARQLAICARQRRRRRRRATLHVEHPHDVIVLKLVVVDIEPLVYILPRQKSANKMNRVPASDPGSNIPSHSPYLISP